MIHNGKWRASESVCAEWWRRRRSARISLHRHHRLYQSMIWVCHKRQQTKNTFGDNTTQHTRYANDACGRMNEGEKDCERHIECTALCKVYTHIICFIYNMTEKKMCRPRVQMIIWRCRLASAITQFHPIIYRTMRAGGWATLNNMRCNISWQEPVESCLSI